MEATDVNPLQGKNNLFQVLIASTSDKKASNLLEAEKQFVFSWMDLYY